MRADRLLSLLMLLQIRGTSTAQALALALEVTERTIYRDVTALSAAGIPVYTERGPGGGISLLEDYRTNLTGLKPSEVRALFMLSIPAPLNQLGVGDELRMALLKLSAALPDSRRVEEAAARQKIHLDASWWFQPEEPLPHLKTIQSALWRDLQLDIIYLSDFGAEIPIHLAPYGLVAKANIWYLVGVSDETLRVLRVSQVRQASISDDTFIRPLDFDLPVYWKAWCDEYENSRPQYTVTARVSPQLAELLSGNISSVQMQTTSFQPDDWQIMQLGFETLETARAQILSYGGAIEVLNPLALRRSVIDFALQTAARYTSPK